MRRILVITLIFVSLIACTKDKPGKDFIPPEILVPVLIDMHLVYSLQSAPEYRTLSRKFDSIDTHTRIFEKYDLTQADFDSTIAWYSRHPEFFTGIYDEVVMQLTQMSDSLKPEPEYPE